MGPYHQAVIHLGDQRYHPLVVVVGILVQQLQLELVNQKDHHL
jgi:hypothetical protein